MFDSFDCSVHDKHRVLFFSVLLWSPWFHVFSIFHGHFNVFFFFFAYSSIFLTNLITFFLVVVHVLGTEKVFCSGVRQHLDSSGALEASCSIFKLSASSRPHVCFYIKILKFFNFSFPSSACETTLKSSTQQLLHPHHISNSNQVWFSAVLERKTDVGTLP